MRIDPIQQKAGLLPTCLPHSDDDLLCQAGDTIDNAVFAAISALCPVPLEWDINLIAEITDTIEAALGKRNLPACRPWEDEEQNICYSTSDRCSYCKRQQPAPDSSVTQIEAKQNKK